MIKLTKEQIQYIENYLIKNDVKFWDVRVELLDHIATAVEEKMKQDNKSFLKALSEVHRGFGNQLMPRYDGDYYLEKSLYQANNGFKKFIRNKQKEFGRKYNKEFRKSFKQQFSSSRVYIELVLLVLIAITVFQYSQIATVLLVFFFLVTLEGIKLVQFFRNYSLLKNSLQFNTFISFGGLFYSSQYFIIIGYQSLFESKADVQYQYLILFYCIAFLFIRASLIHFLEFFKTYKQRYKTLLFS